MYRLYKFGAFSFDGLANQVDAVGSGPAPYSYQALPQGGAIDRYGEAQTSPGTVERTKQLRLRANTPEALEDLYFRLLALRGKRDRLYRKTARGAIHWMYARLVEVGSQRSYELARYRTIQDVELRWVCQEPTWRGVLHNYWTLDGGVNLDSDYYLDAGLQFDLAGSPAVVTIPLGTAADPGRAPVRSVRVTVWAGDAEMSNVQIARAGGETLAYNGAIPSAGELTIDAGAMQVACTGEVAPYNNLVLSPTADMAAWITLQPGDNQITVTCAGGGAGAKIDFAFYEAWY
jgi:hypothetical protein